MTIRGAMIFLTAVFCLLGSGPAAAGRFYVQVHGGVTTLNLDDVNDAIDRTNAEIGTEAMDNISWGPEAGLAVGYVLTRELGVGLGYARLFADSEISQDGYLVSFDLPADLFEITLDYLPDNGQKVRVGVGTDLGLVRSAGSVRTVDPLQGDRTESFDGQGFLFAGYAILDGKLSATWSLYGEGGYRHAIISDLEVDGDTVYNPDSIDDKLRFNYSGIFLRVGIRYRP